MNDHRALLKDELKRQELARLQADNVWLRRLLRRASDVANHAIYVGSMDGEGYQRLIAHAQEFLAVASSAEPGVVCSCGCGELAVKDGLAYPCWRKRTEARKDADAYVPRGKR